MQDQNSHSADEPHRKQFVIRVNNTPVEINRASPDGDQILAAAGFLPVHEHILIQLLEREARAIAPHQKVQLKEDGIEVFRAFKSDGTKRFQVLGNDEHAETYDWGADSISEADLRDVVSVPADQMLELKTDRGWEAVRSGTEVSLKADGVERFRRVRRMVKVFFEGEERLITGGRYSTEELKQIFGVKAGYELNLIRGEDLITLKPSDFTVVLDGMRFFEQAPCGAAS